MMMTAAGTVPAAKVYNWSGVAGLQAIATAKSLGAIVSCNRCESLHQKKSSLESLGGQFSTG